MDNETKGKDPELGLENGPAVGLQFSYATDPDAVAGTICQGQRHGHEVFVVPDPEVKAEIRDRVVRLNAMLVGVDAYCELRKYGRGS
jgi:hypothetical protein